MDLIRLPAIRCEFGEMNAKYQMQLRLRDLASPANPPKYPSIHINEDTLTWAPAGIFPEGANLWGGPKKSVKGAPIFFSDKL